ncbi:MAG: hypothetical protein KAR39_10895 [Thermoplasmata archaeon]|nr:hypothetical protein [Thermoplasmata archaeon]
MNEIMRIKNWLIDSSIPLHNAIELALWDRRDNLLFRQGFIAGAAVAAVVGGLLTAAILRYTGVI